MGARESLNGRKNIYGTKKSKERREEPLGTMSYQTSSKRSPPFWLLIGARKLVFFWHQDFFVSKKEKVKVKMMKLKTNFKHIANGGELGCQLLELPYQGEDLSLRCGKEETIAMWGFGKDSRLLCSSPIPVLDLS